MEINREAEANVNRDQIVKNIQVLVAEILMALQENRSFIVSASVNGRQYPIRVAATFGTNEDLKITAEDFKKNNEDIMAAISKIVGDNKQKKIVGATSEKTPEGGIIIKFNQ